jgi:hypothetical protein
LKTKQQKNFISWGPANGQTPGGESTGFFVADMLGCVMAAPHASLFDTADDAAESAAIARARADFAAGRTVAHAEVIAWLQGWGTAEETPAPLPPAA